jgi:pimeloyl-ACP methyl ester carboxylesterase
MKSALVLLALCCLAAAPARRIPLGPCRLKNAGAQAVCGTLEVPEDRAHPEGRKIKLRVAVVPALARTPQPDPVFLLAGGPGQAATEVFGALLPALGRLHRTRDLVLVDQRGTGSSNPLECQSPENQSLREKLADDSRESVERFRKCVAGWSADTRFYTTPIAMQDLDEVREALGYDQINLWGGSYGTRAALVYLREHQEHVRTVTLDGVAPLSLYLPLDMARDAQRAMNLLFQSCAKDAACNKAFPELEKRFYSRRTDKTRF